MDDSLIFIKAEYLDEVREWLANSGINEHDALGKLKRFKLQGTEIVFLSDPDHQVLFRLSMSHTLSSRSIKITSLPNKND